jgi:hypothetical protein
MKLLIILTISFLIFYYIIKNNCICYNWIKEHFEPLYYNQNDQDYQKIKNSQSSQVNCCLVEKKYIPISNELFGGNFTYLFTKKSNEECDSNLYNLNSNQQLLIEGKNNWSNDYCLKHPKESDLLIGSCRNTNKECIEFVNKKYCDKYKMTWTNKTCEQPLDYKWVDTIKNKIPVNQKNITFKMF